MNRRKIILIYLLLTAFIILLAGAILWSAVGQKTKLIGGVPEQLFSPSELNKIKTALANNPTSELDKNSAERLAVLLNDFALLYNSYATDDYNNITALLSMQTEAMQAKTIARQQKIQNQTKSDFSILTTPDMATLHYDLPDKQSIIATLTAQVDEYQGEKITKSYPVYYKIKLRLLPDKTFLIADTEISPQPF